MSGRMEFIPTRASLLKRLKDWNDEPAWKLFCDTYSGLIYRAATQAGLTHAEAQDVVQETLVSLAKEMPRFDYDPEKGSFKTRLIHLVEWRIASQFRKRLPAAQNPAKTDPATGSTDSVERVPDPLVGSNEKLWEEEWHATVLELALKRVKSKANPRDFQIFHLHVVKRWSVLRVARGLHISRPRVYLAKHRVGFLLRREVARLKLQVV